MAGATGAGGSIASGGLAQSSRACLVGVCARAAWYRACASRTELERGAAVVVRGTDAGALATGLGAVAALARAFEGRVDVAADALTAGPVGTRPPLASHFPTGESSTFGTVRVAASSWDWNDEPAFAGALPPR
jgi:hypothetical protein